MSFADHDEQGEPSGVKDNLTFGVGGEVTAGLFPLSLREPVDGGTSRTVSSVPEGSITNLKTPSMKTALDRSSLCDCLSPRPGLEPGLSSPFTFAMPGKLRRGGRRRRQKEKNVQGSSPSINLQKTDSPLRNVSRQNNLTFFCLSIRLGAASEGAHGPDQYTLHWHSRMA